MRHKSELIYPPGDGSPGCIRITDTNGAQSDITYHDAQLLGMELTELTPDEPPDVYCHGAYDYKRGKE